MNIKKKKKDKTLAQKGRSLSCVKPEEAEDTNNT